VRIATVQASKSMLFALSISTNRSRSRNSFSPGRQPGEHKIVAQRVVEVLKKNLT